MDRPTLSPDGRTKVEWGYSQGRMSHEIWAPRITDAETGEVVLDLWDGMWDGWVQWLEHGVMRVSIREYLEGGRTVLWVDVDRKAGVFWVDGGGRAADGGDGGKGEGGVLEEGETGGRELDGVW